MKKKILYLLSWVFGVPGLLGAFLLPYLFLIGLLNNEIFDNIGLFYISSLCHMFSYLGLACHYFYKEKNINEL